MKKKCLAWILSVLACVGSFSACEGLLPMASHGDSSMADGSGDSFIVGSLGDSPDFGEIKSEYDIIGEEVTAEEWQAAINNIDWRYGVIEFHEFEKKFLNEEKTEWFGWDWIGKSVHYENETYDDTWSENRDEGGEVDRFRQIGYSVEIDGKEYSYTDYSTACKWEVQTVVGWTLEELVRDDLSYIDAGNFFEQNFNNYTFDATKGVYYRNIILIDEAEEKETGRVEFVFKESALHSIKIQDLYKKEEYEELYAYKYYFVKEPITLPDEDKLNELIAQNNN